MEDQKRLNELAIAAGQRVKEKNYWLNKLSGEWLKSSFPYDYQENSDGARPLEEAAFHFSNETTAELLRLGGGSDIRLYTVLLSGLSALLLRYTDMPAAAGDNGPPPGGDSDIVVGTTIPKPGQDTSFINTLLVLRTSVNPRMTFKELVLQTRQTVAEALENRNYPIEILAKQLNMSFSSRDRSPLFDIALLVENIHDRKYLGPLGPGMIFSFTRCESSLRGRLEYDPLSYRKTTIERIIRHYRQLLREAVSHVDVPLAHIDFITDEEKKRLLVDFNGTAAEYPGDKTIHELFAQQAEKTPDRVAVIGEAHESKKLHIPNYKPLTRAVEIDTDIGTITYKELNRRANRLAHMVKEKGVGPDTIVGIVMERSIDIIVGIMGILKAGGAYLPMDPGSPQERIDYMLKDSEAKVLVTTSTLAGEGKKVRRWEGETVLIEKYLRKSHPLTFSPSQLLSSSTLAYVLYTSGTTGRPKGVLVEHRSVVRLVTNTDYIEFRERDRILQTGAVTFDASTFEIWGSLLNGLTLYPVPGGEIVNTGVLIRRYDISIIWLTSALFNQLCGEDVESFAGVRTLLVGGDVLSPVYIDKVRRRFPGLTVLNGYGPTENTTFSTVFSIEKEYKGSIPIGRPISNSTAYILDRWGRLVPVGVAGELCVGGDGLARGYLNNPELTDKKFKTAHENHELLEDKRLHVPPDTNTNTKHVKKKGKKGTGKNNYLIKSFSGDPGGTWRCGDKNGQGGDTPVEISDAILALQMPPHAVGFFKKVPPGRRRYYKTGDLARWLADGSIEFLGRIDHQVKIRGFRIEPGEIERRLLNHDRVKEALVLARENKNGNKYLCAYITAVPPGAPGVPELKEYLSGFLPGYMVPSYIVVMAKIPLTGNGKVDRAGLPGPGYADSGGKATYAGPETEMEKSLVDIWREVLGVDKVGIHDNFFDLGGNSLNIVRLARRLKEIFQREIPTVTLFRFSKISSFLEYMERLEESKEKLTATGKERAVVVGRGKDMMRQSLAKKRSH